MSSTPRNLVSPKDGAAGNGSSPRNGTEHKEDEEGWSGEEEEEDVGGDGSRKRKRPMSVSCELCKQRKACNTSISHVASGKHRGIDDVIRSNAIEVSLRVVGVSAMPRSASTRSERNLVFVPAMEESLKQDLVSGTPTSSHFVVSESSTVVVMSSSVARSMRPRSQT